MGVTFVGFDSAWTDNLSHPGAILYRMANHFELGRLREATRVRFQSAINLARQALTNGAIWT
jgi:predicted RNase H-like nuclease